jgi:hypothetical protein
MSTFNAEYHKLKKRLQSIGEWLNSMGPVTRRHCKIEFELGYRTSP